MAKDRTDERKACDVQPEVSGQWSVVGRKGFLRTISALRLFELGV